MARKSDVRYFESRNAYFTTWKGKQYKLAEGPDDKPTGPTFEAALARFKEIMVMGQADTANDYNTVKVVFERYLRWAEGHRAANTLQIRVRFLNQFAGYRGFGALQVREVKHFHLDEFLAAMQEPKTMHCFAKRGQTESKPGRAPITRQVGWTGSTPTMAVESLLAAFNWAVKKGLTQTNPLKGFEKPESRSRSRDLLINDELHGKILAVSSPSFRDVVKVLKLTGARPSELSSATAAAFNRSTGPSPTTSRTSSGPANTSTSRHGKRTA
jgi:hypothetical protein